MNDDAELYERPDGIVDVEWMRPYREYITCLLITDTQKYRLNECLDEVYRRAVEDRTEEAESNLGMLRVIFREASND